MSEFSSELANIINDEDFGTIGGIILKRFWQRTTGRSVYAELDAKGCTRSFCDLAIRRFYGNRPTERILHSLNDKAEPETRQICAAPVYRERHLRRNSWTVV